MQSKRTRRAPGTGTIITDNGRWKAKWYSPEGVQIKRTLGPMRTPGKQDGLTRAEAEAKLRELMASTGAGHVDRKASSRNVDGWVSLSELAELHIEALLEKGKKESTVTDYRSAVINHFVPFFGHAPIQRISVEQCEAFKRKLLNTTSARTGKPLSVKSVHNYLSILRAMLNFAHRKGWLQVSPMYAVELPVVADAVSDELSFLEPHEVMALADAAVDGPYQLLDRALYLMAAMTGLRQGELRGLQWQHLDFHNHTVRVRRNIVRGRETNPKGKKARPLSMPKEVAAALLELRASSPWTAPGDTVFACASTGGPMSRDKLMERYRVALAAAGLPVGFKFHDLRHTFGTTMAAHGVPIWQIQQWMGHAQPSTTEIYLHYRPRREDADLVSAAFGFSSSTKRLREAS